MTSKITDELKKFLADNYALYLKLHNYHYNVKGPGFMAYHLAFEAQYTELTTALDNIAERIRQLDVLVPVTFKELDSLKSIKDPNNRLDAAGMVKDLLESHDAIVKNAKRIMPMAEDAKDYATVDLLTQRISVHEKSAWLLKSGL
jgi:starvation-inducible DNA-binding protein